MIHDKISKMKEVQRLGMLSIVALLISMTLGELSQLGLSQARLAVYAQAPTNQDAGASHDSTTETSPALQDLASQLYSPVALLIDLESDQVLMDQLGDALIYPASMTKMMTVLLGLEIATDLDAKVTIPPEIYADLYAQGASMAGFFAGETVTVRDLLYGVMLPSGAEAAISLATALAGSSEEFVALMNKKAQDLGMDQTHFVNTTGLHDDSHYTSAKDLAILVKYALNNPDFYQIFTSPTYTSTSTDAHPQGLVMQSTLFEKLGGQTLAQGQILGGKTGYTEPAGLCLASIAEIKGRRYLLITAGSQGDMTTQQFHVTDALTVYNYLGQLP